MRGEVVRVFEEPICGSDENIYVALICARPVENGVWEGWIEFVLERGGPVLRSQRETTQSNHRNLEGWANHLSRVYLEGSLERALYLEKPRVRPPAPDPERPHFEGPARSVVAARSMAPDDAVLSPFLYYRAGETVLREKLENLSAADLRAVIWAYDLGIGRGAEVSGLPRSELIELIVKAVRERMEW